MLFVIRQGHGVRIVMSGLLEADDGTSMIGSLFLVEAADRATVEKFSQADLFHSVGECPDNRIHTSARLDRRWRFNTVLLLRVVRAAPRHLATPPPGSWRIASIHRTTYARLGAGHTMVGAIAHGLRMHVSPRGLPMIQFPGD
jgi:hypothetical protein